MEDMMPEDRPSQDAFPLLTRKDGIQFVRDELGFPLSASLLDKKCMRGEGPDAAGYWGKREMYTRQKLKEWLSNYSLNTQLTSAPTHTQYRQVGIQEIRND